MEPPIATLVLLSAALHPMWNALIKKDDNPEQAYLVLTMLLMVAGGGHALLAGIDLLSVAAVWPLIVVSWLGQILYGSCLLATLRRGDLSAYYPIVRSSPLFIVVCSWVLFGESHSWLLLLGIAVVLTGAFFLQYQRRVRLMDDPRTLILAVLAMSGTGIYSIADSRIATVVAPSVLMFWVEGLCLPSYFFVFRTNGRVAAGWRTLLSWLRNPLRFVVVAAICYGSYFLILWAYELGGQVATVSAVRQASIPISVFIGGLYLREGSMAQRFGASLVLALGIVVILLAH